MTADLHQAWDHAVHHDRDLAVELAALIYDFAYQRQRLDLLDWGLQVAGWDLEHPMLSQALATAAAAAWAAGELRRAEEIALRGIRAAEDGDRPASARTVGQAGNLAMFARRLRRGDRAVRGSRAAEPREGRDLAALMCEVCVCQAHDLRRRAAEARTRLVDLRDAPAPAEPERHRLDVLRDRRGDGGRRPAAALTAYRTAVEESLKVDNRLFLGLARSCAVALAARRGSPQDALAEFELVMDEWDELGNVAAQWWVLLRSPCCSPVSACDRPAALLAGAFRANGTGPTCCSATTDRLQASIATLTDAAGRADRRGRPGRGRGARLRRRRRPGPPDDHGRSGPADRRATARGGRQAAGPVLRPWQCRRMASMCRASVPQHPPSTVSWGSCARSAA